MVTIPYKVKTANVITVGPSGLFDHDSLEDAHDAISGNTSTNPFVVVVSGKLATAAGFTWTKSFVTIRGEPGSLITLSDTLQLGDGSTILESVRLVDLVFATTDTTAAPVVSVGKDDVSAAVKSWDDITIENCVIEGAYRALNIRGPADTYSGSSVGRLVLRNNIFRATNVACMVHSSKFQVVSQGNLFHSDRTGDHLQWTAVASTVTHRHVGLAFHSDSSHDAILTGVDQFFLSTGDSFVVYTNSASTSGMNRYHAGIAIRESHACKRVVFVDPYIRVTFDQAADPNCTVAGFLMEEASTGAEDELVVQGGKIDVAALQSAGPNVINAVRVESSGSLFLKMTGTFLLCSTAGTGTPYSILVGGSSCTCEGRVYSDVATLLVSGTLTALTAIP